MNFHTRGNGGQVQAADRGGAVPDAICVSAGQVVLCECGAAVPDRSGSRL